MSECKFRDDNINNFSKNIDSVAKDILKKIQKCLFKKADFAGPKISVPSFGEFSHKQKSISAKQLVVIFEKNQIENILRRDPDFTPGAYEPHSGKILLNKEIWCIKTLIHEVLHACSKTKINYQIIDKYETLYEGLTEFFTGFILFKEYNYTFDNCWKLKSGRRCQRSYEPAFRVWSSFFNLIPINKLVKVYFFPFSEKWDENFQKMIDSINNDGYPQFKNPLLAGKYPVHLRLHIECMKNFGNVYTAIYKDPKKYFDFNLIKEN